MQTKQQALRLSLALSALIAASAVVSADEYVDKAKAYIDQITKPGAAWTGPTSGPKAQGHKSIVFVNYDQRNSGGRAVGEFAAEAAKILGWDYRVLDGQGTVSGQTAALNQAIALKPDGIILGSVDAIEHNPEITQAVKNGIKVVSWHSGTNAGKLAGSPIFTNVTTRSDRGGARRGTLCGRRFERNRPGGSVHRQRLPDLHHQDECGKGGGRGLQDLQGPGDRGHAPGRSVNAHAAADRDADRQVRRELDPLDRHQRSLFRLHGAFPAIGGR